GLVQGSRIQGAVARAPLGQMGPHLRRRDGPEVGQTYGLPPMPLQKGDIESSDMAIGFQGAGRQPALVSQMLQPGRERLVGGQLRMGHRSAMRSMTRVRKDTSSQPMTGVKPSGSDEPKAHR